jgi:hypothetical protein
VLRPTPDELARRHTVMSSVLQAIRANQTIKLPDFDPAMSRPATSALVSVGIEPNAFGGTVGLYRYQLEGEEDLLHLIVTRIDQGPLTAEEGQEVAGFLYRGVPPALIWLKPGEVSQHFYLGHDELLTQLQLD